MQEAPEDSAKASGGDVAMRQADEGAAKVDEGAAKVSKPAAPVKPAAPPQEKESEKGMIWTYEVTGKKIGIREGPSIDSNQQGDYIENGELFNVIERVRGGGDVRVYLRLADG